MPVNLSIKKVPGDIVEQLRNRAKRNHRSLQGEMLSILENTVARRPLSVEETAKRIRALSFTTEGDSVKILREDRNGR